MQITIYLVLTKHEIISHIKTNLAGYRRHNLITERKKAFQFIFIKKWEQIVFVSQFPLYTLALSQLLIDYKLMFDWNVQEKKGFIFPFTFFM